MTVEDPGLLEKIYRVAVIVLAGCAVVVAVLLVRREFSDRTTSTGQERAATHVGELPSLDSLYRIGHVIGARHAEITILEFSDYQCPYCARAQPDLRRLLVDYPNDVALVYLHFPIESQHPQAVSAALGAEYAAAQGAFGSFHELLFEQQDSLAYIELTRLAERAGVPDTARFRSCLDQRRFVEVVNRHREIARSAGVRATPTFVIGDSMLSGYDAVGRLRRWVRGRLGR